jgi:O-antigen/teichoic acid export membrane protein
MAAYLILAGVIVVVVGLTGDPILRFFRAPPELIGDGSAALFLSACALGIGLAATPYAAALASQLRHDVQHYSDIFESLFRVGFIVIVFSLWEPRIQVWAVANLLPAAIVLLLIRSQAYRHCPSLELGRKLLSRAAARELGSSGFYTSIAQLSEWLDRYSGPLVIGYLLGASLVAHYTPAMVLASAIQLLSSSFLLQLHPFVTKAAVEAQAELIQRVLLRSTRYSLLLSGAAAAWFGSLSPVVIACWLGRGFEDTAVVLALWCATILLQACEGGSFAVFLGLGRFRFVAVVNGLLGLISIGGALWLVGPAGYGVAGAAVAVLGAQLVRTVVRTVGAGRIAGVAAGEYLRESYAGPLACIAVLVATSASCQILLDAPPWAELAIAGTCSLLLFGALAWGVGLNAQDREKAFEHARRGLTWALALRGRR